VAPPDVIPPQSLEVNSRQALVDSQAALSQQEVQLKNLLSRSGTADPDLAAVRILPVDPIAMPEKDDLPPLADLVKQAIANRSDLAAARINDAAAEVSALGTRNGVLPNLLVFGAESHAGLAGEPRTVISRGTIESADPYFTGGIGTAMAQLFRRNFPTERIGAFYQSPIHNWAAQADFAIDQLQNRQSDLGTRKNLNQVQVDVLNYVVMLQQARARYDTAVRNRGLQEQLFAGEQRRFTLGASTPYNVTQQQRDLVTAQNAVMAALVSYTTARLALDQAMGATLEVNLVQIAEAREGRVAR
jgi:outer membrane protein TolC